jgi:hypothetical protein
MTGICNALIQIGLVPEVDFFMQKEAQPSVLLSNDRKSITIMAEALKNKPDIIEKLFAYAQNAASASKSSRSVP